MKFSIAACAATVGFVFVQGLASLLEGTFTKNRWVTMGFFNHGGMWGDLLLLSIVNGLFWPHISSQLLDRLIPVITALIATFILTFYIHITWAEWFSKLGVTGHMFEVKAGFTFAGWLHVIYMTFQLTLIVLYILATVPGHTVWIASSLLTAHVFLGTIQPGWYVTGQVWTKSNFLPPLACAILIWIIAAVKLRSA